MVSFLSSLLFCFTLDSVCLGAYILPEPYLRLPAYSILSIKVEGFPFPFYCLLPTHGVSTDLVNPAASFFQSRPGRRTSQALAVGHTSQPGH